MTPLEKLAAGLKPFEHDHEALVQVARGLTGEPTMGDDLLFVVVALGLLALYQSVQNGTQPNGTIARLPPVPADNPPVTTTASGGSQPSADQIVALAAGLDPENPASLQELAQRLKQAGYAASVMAAGDGSMSDHKAWINGAAWTLISSDGYMPGTYRFDPYIQVGDPGAGYLPCGIPNSAGLACPSWS